jgi:hypothetical protein
MGAKYRTAAKKESNSELPRPGILAVFIFTNPRNRGNSFKGNIGSLYA